MPTLDAEQLAAVRARPVRICEECGRAVAWNYCRQCDEYFESGHMQPTHDSHRTY
jgi:hypothetical protein